VSFIRKSLTGPQTIFLTTRNLGPRNVFSLIKDYFSSIHFFNTFSFIILISGPKDNKIIIIGPEKELY